MSHSTADGRIAAFAKCFRELFGCDPSRYQARCEAEERRGKKRGDGQLPTAEVTGVSARREGPMSDFLMAGGDVSRISGAGV